MKTNWILLIIVITIIYLLFNRRETYFYPDYDPNRDRLLRIVNTAPPGVQVENPGMTWVL
jgi:hypothetical protein